jgi:hypothetical protein
MTTNITLNVNNFDNPTFNTLNSIDFDVNNL